MELFLIIGIVFLLSGDEDTANLGWIFLILWLIL